MRVFRTTAAERLRLGTVLGFCFSLLAVAFHGVGSGCAHGAESGHPHGALGGPLVEGHVLRIRIPRLPDSLNPALTTDLWAWRISFPWVYQPLVRREPETGRIQGVLAAGWREKRTKDPMKSLWTISLRRGLTWHDGKAVTARDVAFSLEVAVGRKAAWLRAVGLRHRIFFLGRVKVLDHLTLVLEASRFFLAQAASVPILPEHLLGRCPGLGACLRAAQEVVGSGPWRVARLSAGKELVLVRRKPLPREKRRRAKGAVSGVRFVVEPDSGRALALLKTGQLDLVAGQDAVQKGRVLLHAAAQLKKTAGFRLLSLSAHGLTLLRVYADGDAKLARALAALVDRARFPWPAKGPRPAVLDSADSPQQRGEAPAPHGLKTAVRLLEQAGWKLGSGQIRSKRRPLVVVALAPLGSEETRRGWWRHRGLFRRAGVDLKLLLVPREQYRLLFLWTGNRMLDYARKLLSMRHRPAAVLFLMRDYEPSSYVSPFRWLALLRRPVVLPSRPSVPPQQKRAEPEWRKQLVWLQGKSGLFPFSGVGVFLLAGRRVESLSEGGMWFDPDGVRLRR